MKLRVLPALLAAWLVLLASPGCKRTHPIKVTEDPELTSGVYDQVGILPFMSTVGYDQDPDDRSAAIFQSLFTEALEGEPGYTFYRIPQVEAVIEEKELESAHSSFQKTWIEDHRADPDFLGKLGEALKVDAVLVGVVDLWQKDEVEYYESGSSATYVGATVSLVRVSDGHLLWEASDEDYIEKARNEASDRIQVRSASGNLQRVSGSNTISGDAFAAPDHDLVARKVVNNLLLEFPAP
jgi:hypothetical protein